MRLFAECGPWPHLLEAARVPGRLVRASELNKGSLVAEQAATPNGTAWLLDAVGLDPVAVRALEWPHLYVATEPVRGAQGTLVRLVSEEETPARRGLVAVKANARLSTVRLYGKRLLVLDVKDVQTAMRLGPNVYGITVAWVRDVKHGHGLMFDAVGRGLDGVSIHSPKWKAWLVMCERVGTDMSVAQDEAERNVLGVLTALRMLSERVNHGDD